MRSWWRETGWTFLMRPCISETVVSEIFYVFCRQKGFQEAKKKIDLVLDGAEVIEGREIQMIAGKYKCERAISLSDCFTMAVSKSIGSPALFKAMTATAIYQEYRYGFSRI